MQTPTHKKTGVKRRSPKMDRKMLDPTQLNSGVGADDTAKPAPRVRSGVKAAVTKKPK
jgi:hypothetical protein